MVDHQSARIAIVGLGGIFPGAPSLDDFWRLIASGMSAAREVPAERWSVAPDECLADDIEDDCVYSKRACLIDGFELDLHDLDIDPALVKKLDPMFHLLLHAGRDAWLDANTQSVNKDKTGIIIGNIALPTESSSHYTDDVLGELFCKQLNLPSMPKHGTDAINRYVAGLPAGVLAQALGLGAGTYTLDAACASSLYAIKYAADELISGRVDCMLAGGLSRPDSQYTQMGFSQLHALSASGNCSPFSKDADGLVVGEGAGILVMKRLDDALRDKDHIYGCLAGSGLSNDIEGNLFLPASEGQFRAMQAAYTQSNWPVNSVDLIECHGTGTPKGDAVEFNSLSQLWHHENKQQQCIIGSVKSNVGHLLTGAGAAGIIKVLLALKHKTLPPTANYTKPSSEFDIHNSPFKVLDAAQTWEKPQEHPRRAAVSAFGFGGINAHLLIEEWENEEQAPMVQNTYHDEDIAIVACDAHFGPWSSKAQIENRLFNSHENRSPQEPSYWYGSEQAASVKTFSIDNVDIPIGRFRIPPTELSDCLPQQLLMLQVAANAMDEYDDEQANRYRCGTYIGIGLDPNTCNFHFRWQLHNQVKENWGKELNPEQQHAFTKALRDNFCPPLTANRTMGALGGIVASRVARALRIGGPSFTISNEECSGMQALQMGIESLRRGEIDQALVGAVDFASEIRAAFSHHHSRIIGGNSSFFDADAGETILGDGACAFVLKRLSDAEKDGDTIYACIKDVYQAHAGDAASGVPQQQALTQCLRKAYRQESIHQVDLLLVQGTGNRSENKIEQEAYQDLLNTREKPYPCAINNTINDFGHTGAASGLANILKACLSLRYKLIPQQRHYADVQNVRPFGSGTYSNKDSHYWLRNKENGPRHAGITSFSSDGNALHAILSEYDEVPHNHGPDYQYPAALFLCSAANTQSLLEQLDELEHFCAPYQELHNAAHHWWHSHNLQATCRCSLIAQNQQELRQLINQLRQAIHAEENAFGPKAYYLHNQESLAGDLAFVYPGSGNHFAGMAAGPGMYWPQIYAKQDQESNKHRSQFAEGRFWSENNCDQMDHRDVIFGQVCCGTMITDSLTQFGLEPNAVIGYSLGETAGFFSTRTWTARDEMLKRIVDSRLFTEQLAGPCTAVQEAWNNKKDVHWSIAVIDRSEEETKAALKQFEHAYLLIVNTPHECVVGGDKDAVEALIDSLQCQAHPIEGVTTVHCDVALPVKKPYRDLHLFDCTPLKGVRYYSGILGKSYEVTTDSAADSIVGQALEPFNYAQVINQAYADGVRVFIEMGPRSSCTRMIDQTLGDKDHLAISASVASQDASITTMHVLAQLHMAGKDLHLQPLYGRPLIEDVNHKHIQVANGKTGFNPVSIPQPNAPTKPVAAPAPTAPQSPKPISLKDSAAQTNIVATPVAPNTTSVPKPLAASTSSSGTQTLVQQLQQSQTAMQATHERFIQLQNTLNTQIAEALQWQLQALGGQTPAPSIATHSTAALAPAEAPNTNEAIHPVNPSPSGDPVLFDYHQCMEIAIGKLGNVLPEFAEADSYPTRVRLPDEPLMLAHRIMRIEGEAKSMTSGRVITEHDIIENAWYLDGGVIPTCIAVEAGQADLFLSGYLGIDFITKGEATYRLLDAEVTFHRPLPGAGHYIRYDIEVLEFFKQGDTYLFRFQFDATVNGELLLTMRKGIAGFFTQEELDAGKGVVLTKMDKQETPGVAPQGWTHPVPMIAEAYSEEQLQNLRNGDLSCFGPSFQHLPLHSPLTIPDGRMRLVHRIKHVIPHGGRHGLGQIIGEADIHSDDWFLTCHFCDDMVMPGTLMYECCLHTLRVYLMRMGWIGEADHIHYEPIPGISSILKCRGQVLQDTKMVTYELTIKEIGYRDDDEKPYCIADALMYGDGKAIVHMKNMSVQIAGLSKSHIDALWGPPANPLDSDPDYASDKAIFTDEQIVAFAEGKPSFAFGDKYAVFDNHRKIARLPRDPFKFLNRITMIRDCEQWKLEAGGTIVARYDVPPDAWYFDANEQGGSLSMPFSVLLETALQPCGWLAAYLGSALTNEDDIKFRNLGGSATQYIEVTPDIGTLSTKIKITNVSMSGGMIIQNYDMEMWSQRGLVYKGNTVFGFFSIDALANQIGIRDATLFEPDQSELARGTSFEYPKHAPFPNEQMRMISQIEHFDPNGGEFGLGGIIGTMPVDPDAWFFQAHFYQDPVIPGSLGLESFQQLLKVAAFERWAEPEKRYHFESMTCNQEHTWVYRGQVIPKDSQVTVRAEVTSIDETQKIMTGRGHLIIDDRVIYQMIQFSIQLRES